ncbi:MULTISPECIES: PQQ-binding-like beta-propeller repeat protein [Haloarcula]|uniref:PQQ-binding-like beta-propeller repeat protein n=1 Tax=Haloarcula TaxID=2237 RepID=UPI0023E87FFE|nr:PQQ-binding-like beta-propeller repeat protein [Halomicroarcula sp. SHR3]
MHRRRAVLATVASGVTATLAGCGGESSAADTATPTSDGTPTSEETPTIDAVDEAFPQFQYDAENSGSVPDVRGPTGDVGPAFEFGGGGVESGHQLGSPTLADGTVYVAEGTIDDNDEAETVVYALDGVDGSVVWEQSYGETNGAGQTAVTDDVVLAVVSGMVVGLDRSTGEKLWSVSRDLDSGIAVADGSVYVAGSTIDERRVFSLSVADGTVQWQTDIDAEYYFPTPAVADGTVYVGGRTLQALDAETGEERWAASPQATVTAPPTVVDDTVVVGGEDTLRAYARSDGTEQWAAEVTGYSANGGATVTHSPAVAGDQVHVVAAWGLSAYDLETGERRYTTETGLDGTPVVADGHLYVPGLGELACFSTADGSEVWRYGTDQSSGAGNRAPAVVDGVAYFPAEKLYAMTV